MLGISPYKHKELWHNIDMNLHRNYLVVAMVLLTTGCHKDNTNCRLAENFERVDTVCYREPIDTLCAEYIDEVIYVGLNHSEEHIIPEATKIEVLDGKIFVFSKRLQKVVAYAFDGGFLYEISHRGKGAQEYLEIANFTVDDKTVYLVDNIRHQIVKYAVADGQYQGRKDIDFVAWDMSWLAEDKFLFTFLPNNREGRVNMKQPAGSVWETDSTFSRIIEEYLPYAEDYQEMVGKNVYFTRNRNQVVFQSYQHAGYFIFSANHQPQYIHLALPESVPSMSRMKYQDVVHNQYPYLAETPLVTDDYTIFAMGKGGFGEPVLIKKVTKGISKNRESTSYNVLLSPSFATGNQFGVYLSDYDFYTGLVADGFPRADERTEETLEKGGACLIVYSMKPSSKCFK